MNAIYSRMNELVAVSRLLPQAGNRRRRGRATPPVVGRLGRPWSGGRHKWNVARICCLLLLLTAWRAEAAAVSWVGGSGNWNTATNWSTGALPGPGDDVVISPVATSITVTHSSGAHTVNSLMSQVAFQLTGGSLTVSNTWEVNNTFMVAGGALVEATVLLGTNGGSFIVNGSGTLDAVTVNGVLDVGNSYSGAVLTVTNGLVLNGTALVGNPTNSNYGAISFAGSQTLSGNGSVVFGFNASVYNALRVANGGTTLTIGSGMTVWEDRADRLCCQVLGAARPTWRSSIRA